MTNEEAKSCILTIKMLRRLAYNIHGVIDVIDSDNCEKIIKVLSDIPKYKDAYGKGWDDGAKATYEHLKMCEEEQSGDLISRDELLKAIDTWDKFGCDADTKLVPYQDHYIPYIHYDDVIKCIKGMTSVNPQEPKWIPVGERLPEIDEPVLIFQRYYSGANITIGRYHSDEEQGGYRYWQWIKYDNHFSYGIDHFGIICPDSYYVDAWMPLPKLYEPQGSKEISDINLKMWQEIFKAESDHKCHTCKHYTSGEHDGSCGSYICKEYSNWESEE